MATARSKPPKYSTFASESPSDTAAPVLHPLSTSSWLSLASFSWVTPLVARGNEKSLDEHDVWPLQSHHQVAVVCTRFAADFERTRSIPRAFFGSFLWRFVLTGVAFFVAAAMAFGGPVVLNHAVSELASGEYDVADLSLWIFGLLATQVIQALADNYAYFDAEVIAIQFTAALKNMIYRKSLALNADSRKRKSTADIANLCKTDSEMIMLAANYVHQLWIIPLQIIIAGVLLYRLLGVAVFAGFGVIALTMGINRFFSIRYTDLYKAAMKRKDDRLKVITEVFKSISIIKFNAWEDMFLDRIRAVRTIELTATWELMRLISISVMFSGGVSIFVSVGTFAVYGGLMHQPMAPSVVFTSVTLFQFIRTPLRYLTDIIASCSKAAVAEKRITEFLALPELDKDSVTTIHHEDADKYIADNVIVSIENATFAWGANETSLLKDVNLRVKAGDFVVIHGPVGCGKSSLLSTLIGDMTKTHGRVYVGGNVAYCAQQPWIQHATVRDNILFGLPFDRKKYERVLDACALTQDLKSLPAADRTEIGERGINLSGGQKARVALARACYSDASVYVLDAPLSAVDAIVQNEIFQKCLVGLLRHRTIILVTHNPEIIASEHVTRAVTINADGAVVETRVIQGERPVTSPGSTVAPFAPRPYAKESGGVGAVEVDYDAEFVELTDLSLGLKSLSRQRSRSHSNHEDDDDLVATHATGETHRLVDDEERQQGRVGFHVFAAYYHAVGGLPVLALLLFSQVVWQTLQISSDFWLSDWSADANSPTTPDSYSTAYRVRIYTLLGLTSAVMVLVRVLTVSFFGLGAAKRMFERMTHALMHAPMKFFDSNPIGRILVLYSSDVFNVDFEVPLAFATLLANVFLAACPLLTAAVVIRWHGLFLIPVVIMYIQVGDFYLQPAREIERILRTLEALILSHLSESIEGGATIRAFGRRHVARFRSINDTKLDVANKVWYARLAISRWFALRIQMLSSALVFIVAFSLVMLHNQLSAAIVGLAFSYVLQLSLAMERIVRNWSIVETTMVSPERLQQYTDVEQEAPHKIPVLDPPSTSGWPAHGEVAFTDVSFRYKEADKLVLKSVNFSVAGGEKIGIVGRTGAGKSSLTMALFRINELAGGVIEIDGVDVGKIGLNTLRSKLSIIPQNPVLFKGTLRHYLDPFDEFSDDQIWDAIRRVSLSDRVSGQEQKLEYVVEENGENFSVGERQMLCMTRALLRDSRIVIFDEATAAIDHETDQKLQRVIREAFDSSTVLTIAHRLDTILDSDRILVLDGGRVVEFASPAELVKKGTGHFFDLMQEGGYLGKFMTTSYS